MSTIKIAKIEPKNEDIYAALIAILTRLVKMDPEFKGNPIGQAMNEIREMRSFEDLDIRSEAQIAKDERNAEEKFIENLIKALQRRN